jgi:uncharacterized damage-inducible protein DinB
VADTIETLLAPLPGFRSAAVARFMWQLDEQRGKLLEAVEGLTPEQLDWQPHPGMNTIGMLLAHIAYAESHLAQIGIEGRASSDTSRVIGLTEEQEGMPLAPDAPPSPALRGRPLADFVDMLARAREYTRSVCAGLGDADLERRIERPPRPDGTRRAFNVGWVLYHMLEHEAGHRAQIGLILHLQRTRSA